MNNINLSRAARCGLAVLLLGGALLASTGCAGPGQAISDEARARAIAETPKPPVDADFPALASAKWAQGAFPSVEALRKMNVGMGKDQVRELLNWPHFSEGLAGVREWNYIFHFRTGKGPEFITCQYMVRYNEDMLTNGLYWKDRDCAMFVNPPPVKPLPVAEVATPAPPPPPAPAPKKVSFGADGLFRFNGSSLTDLQPEGRYKIETLAAEIKRHFKTLDYITIRGHTDRIGSDAQNDQLSLARANTVRELLVQQGLDRSAIRASGAGKREPLTECVGSKVTPALVKCLQPNRRVDITVSGQQ